MADTTNRNDGRGGSESWQEQLRRGGLELAILLSLTREPRYGLEIIRHLEETGEIIISRGEGDELVQ